MAAANDGAAVVGGESQDETASKSIDADNNNDAADNAFDDFDFEMVGEKSEASNNDSEQTDPEDFDFEMAGEDNGDTAGDDGVEEGFDFGFDGESQPEKAEEPSLWQDLMKHSRITLKHETSYKTAAPAGLVNNRSSIQYELSKYFWEHFYVRIDTKLNGFWSSDHRAEAEDKGFKTESMTREAFLQGSYGSTAVQLGVQNLIWGESDGGAITDIVSPRNFREIFFIPLEEARIGQFMVKVDQFTDIGDWSLFYVPQAKFNKYPELGTAYYIPVGDGSMEVKDAEQDISDDEYGLRWKERIGRSEVNLMYASVINNNKAVRFDPTQQLLLTEMKRNHMMGVSFNFVYDELLFRGEMAYKTGRNFNVTGLALKETDVIDTAFVVEYSLPGSDTISFELVNNHIRDWDDSFVANSRNTQSLVMQLNLFYFNDDLQVNWMSSLGKPYTNWLNSIRSNYKYNDNLTFSLDLHAVSVNDQRSSLYTYRDQKQVVLRVQYQF